MPTNPKKTLIEHGICLPSRRWMRKKPLQAGAPPIVGMRLIDECPDISDRKVPGNWEGDLIIVPLPLGRKADQVCDALTRRIQGLPDGAMCTLNWDQGPGNGPPPAPDPRQGRGGVFRSPPKPMGERNQRKHQPAYPPIPSHRNPHQQPSTLPRRHRLRTE